MCFWLFWKHTHTHAEVLLFSWGGLKSDMTLSHYSIQSSPHRYRKVREGGGTHANFTSQAPHLFGVWKMSLSSFFLVMSVGESKCVDIQCPYPYDFCLKNVFSFFSADHPETKVRKPLATAGLTSRFVTLLQLNLLTVADTLNTICAVEFFRDSFVHKASIFKALLSSIIKSLSQVQFFFVNFLHIHQQKRKLQVTSLFVTLL